MTGYFIQAFIYLVAAVIAVPLAKRFGLGSVLGYLVAGVVIGPVLGLVGQETTTIQHFAEFGVVMMLFLVGMELDPKGLWAMRVRLLGLGGLQVVLTAAAGAAIAWWLGLVWQTALAVGLIFALSSTAIVLQTLSEKGLSKTEGGRSAFSVLLFQDIAVIPMLALIPLLALPELMGAASDDHGHAGLSLVAHLPAWAHALVVVAAIGSVIVGGYYLGPLLFRYVIGSGLREVFTASALMLVIGIAALMSLVNLSPALGAFLAGIVLANSEFKHEIEANIEPFKGLLLGLFFITVGAGINFDLLFADTIIIVGMALLVILVKGLILYGLGTLFKLQGRDRWLFALGLAQAGEFGFVLVSFSVATGVMPNDVAETLLLVVALSMLITPLLFITYDQISKRMDTKSGPIVADEIDEQGTVIIAGVGRFGQIVNRLVQASGFRTVVLDHNPETIAVMRRFGFKAFLGDPTRADILRKAGLRDAKVLVVALDDPKSALQLIAYARKERPDLHIVTRAHDRTDVYQQYQAGANDIVREMFDSSLRAGRYVLENLGLSDYEAAEAQRMFYSHDRASVRELAALWRPDIPPSENKAYVARAKELQKDLETAFLNRIDQEDKTQGS
ncbi:MAG TPA: potassium transporter [Erythrobacter sp.]|nr:potassium transporter [Erythrobacter sp.]